MATITTISTAGIAAGASASVMDIAPSRIELLAQELLDLILAQLRSADVAHLSLCSKRLYQRSQAVLYGNKVLRARAMRWACLGGVNSLIRRLIPYGESVSAIFIPHMKTGTDFNGNTLTLHLAAKHGRADTFRYLIELGAGVDERDGGPLTFRALVKSLCRPGNVDSLLGPFLDAGLASGLSQEMRDEALLSVLLTTSRKEETTQSVAYVGRLLDSGASPDYVRSGRSTTKGSMSPLSAALFHPERQELFRRLLERGADINGVPDLWPRLPIPRLPLHVPACAAARDLCNNGTGLMQLCLDHGADINVRVPFLKAREERAVSLTTPLIMYLDSEDNDWSSPVALERLQYLLDHGVRFDAHYREKDRQMARHLRAGGSGGSYRFQPAASPLEALLERWTIRHLIHPPFLSALKLLILHGGGQKELFSAYYFAYENDIHLSDSNRAKFLALCSIAKFLALHSHYPCKPGTSEPDLDYPGRDRILVAWQEFVTLLISKSAAEEEDGLDTVLLDYMSWARDWPVWYLPHRDRRTPMVLDFDFIRATVAALIKAGADINSTKLVRLPPALHMLCNIYHPTEITRHRLRLMRFVIKECGADLKLEWCGSTATAMIHRKLKGMERAGMDVEAISKEVSALWEDCGEIYQDT
ncbi:hypothetical protein QBC46DRAFT_387761 [Diplogelasinospora grovesii]|uniref:Ankyrin n=1 Tax=Diplogelasinospora grovesii TaxID=303347 RepID=A0AAN6N6M6_9PEZI|nr:hypothetical protein QBC46DRAFT_387761 [Diplogelasinospora grovesii]